MRDENSKICDERYRTKLLLTIKELKQQIHNKKSDNGHLRNRIDQRKELFYKIEKNYQDKAQIMKNEVE